MLGPPVSSLLGEASVVIRDPRPLVLMNCWNLFLFSMQLSIYYVLSMLHRETSVNHIHESLRKTFLPRSRWWDIRLPAKMHLLLRTGGNKLQHRVGVRPFFLAPLYAANEHAGYSPLPRCSVNQCVTSFAICGPVPAGVILTSNNNVSCRAERRADGQRSLFSLPAAASMRIEILFKIIISISRNSKTLFPVWMNIQTITSGNVFNGCTVAHWKLFWRGELWLVVRVLMGRWGLGGVWGERDRAQCDMKRHTIGVRFNIVINSDSNPELLEYLIKWYKSSVNKTIQLMDNKSLDKWRMSL